MHLLQKVGRICRCPVSVCAEVLHRSRLQNFPKNSLLIADNVEYDVLLNEDEKVAGPDRHIENFYGKCKLYALYFQNNCQNVHITYP